MSDAVPGRAARTVSAPHPEGSFERKVPLVAASILLGLGALGAVLLHRSNSAREVARFDRLSGDVVRAIETRLAAYVSALHAGQGLFEASGAVSQREFRVFTQRLQLQARYPGIQGYGFSRRISDDPPKHAIVYLEPQDKRNRAAMGYDMFSEPIRRRAMARARDTGLPAASGRVRLVQEIDEDVQAGFLIYAPVYGSSDIPASLAARRASLQGFVYAPFRAGDLLSNLVSRPELSLTVWDEADGKAGQPLYRSSASRPDGLAREAWVAIAGRRWLLEIRASRLISRFERLQGAALFLVSVLFALILYRVLLSSERSAVALKQAHAQLREAAQTLEAQVRERTAELANTNEELETFSYTVSHDLRAPLRRIDSFSSLLERRLSQSVPEARLAEFSRIRTAVRQMQALIESLLELSRVVNKPPERRDLDISRLAAELAQPIAAQYTHRVDFRVQPGVAASGDPTLVRVLLTNLLSNAWKYTSNRAEAKIEVGRTETNEIYVQDDGVGIPAAGLKDLFKPFARLHAQDRFEGSGIGLATARRVVARHGGKIRAESVEGKGTTVFFTLS